MKISVVFENAKSESLVNKVREAARYPYGFRSEILQLSHEFGTGAVVDAIVRVCSEGDIGIKNDMLEAVKSA